MKKSSIPTILVIIAILWSCMQTAFSQTSAHDPKTVDTLITVLKDGDDSSRYSAAESLGKIGGSKAVDALITAFNDERNYFDIRYKAVEALIKIGDPKAVGALITALKDDDPYVQGLAAAALGVIGDPKAVGALTLKDDDPVSSLKAVAGNNDAQTLGMIEDLKAVDALITALKDENPYVRKQAAQALGKIGDSNAVDALITALKDNEKNVRMAAATALGDIRDVRAIEALDKAISEAEDKEEQEAFLDAFTEIFADYLHEKGLDVYIGKPKADKNDNAAGQNQGDTDYASNDLDGKSGEGVEDGSSVYQIPPGIGVGSIVIPSPPTGESEAATPDEQNGESEEGAGDAAAGQGDAIIPPESSGEPKEIKEDISGTWTQTTCTGSSDWTFTKRSEGKYDAKESGLGGASGDATYDENSRTIHVHWTCCNDQSEGDYEWVLKPDMASGEGHVTVSRQPAGGKTPTSCKSSITRMFEGGRYDPGQGEQVIGPKPPEDPFSAGFDPEAAESGNGGTF